MPEKKHSFTQAALAALVGTQGKRLVVPDPKTPGLRVELREGGTVTFFVYRWSPTDRKPVRVKLGGFPELTIDAARKAASPLIAKILAGENPATVKRAKRTEATLKELFAHFLETHAKPHKKTWEEDQRQFDKYLAPLHSRRLSSIDKAEVQSLHAKLGKENGHFQANRVLALLRSLFNKADEIGYRGLNPAARIRKFKEQSRDRFLQPDELPRFLEALRNEPSETARDFFTLCLFTGARKQNVAAMRWEQISFDLETWRIPDTKAGRVQFVALSGPALETLRRRHEKTGDSPFVFPAKSRTGYVADLMKPWRNILKNAGITEPIRPHDLRRTFGSYQALSGASLAIIGKTLGHSRQETTAVYARLTDRSVRDSVNTAVSAMLATEKPKAGAE